MFPVGWNYQVGPYTLLAAEGAINVENDLSCSSQENPTCIFDSWQVVDEGSPVLGEIAGYEIANMAINFQDHDAIALDDYDVTEPLDLAEWEVHNGTISLAGLEGEIGVEVVAFTAVAPD